MTKKLTMEYCKLFAENEGYEIQDTYYKDGKQKLNFKHLYCETIFPMRWVNFYNIGQRCPKCAGNMKLKIEDCISIANERGFEILDENFLGSNGRLHLRHIFCDHDFYTTWGNFHGKNSGCPKCAGVLSPTIDFCKQYAIDAGYEIITDYYLNSKSKLLFYHEECGRNFESSWLNFYNNGHRCPLCSISLKLTIEFCKQESEKRGYLLKEKTYINTRTNMEFYHIKCKTYFKTSWASFSQGQECPKCTKEKFSLQRKLNFEDCKKNALDRGYSISDKFYVNTNSKMNFIHLECGNNFPMSYSKFSQGQGCPKCAREKQESSIATNLKQYYSENFGAFTEYEECINPKTGKYLPYDIFIPKYNDQGYDIFIEVQGHQHYRFNYFWHKTLEDFKYQQYKDRIKRKYAEQNGIYIEIDLRQKTPIEDIIQKINNTIQTYS